MDQTKLAMKLRYLAVDDLVETLHGYGVLSSVGGDVSVERVLRQIDSTVMPRLISFAAGGLVLALIVENRRIVAIDKSTSEMLISSPESLLSNQDEATDAIAQSIVKLCSIAEPVTFRVAETQLSTTPHARDQAVSANLLMNHMDVDLWSETAEVFLKFVDQIENYFTTSIMMKSGHLIAEFGDEDRISRMYSDYVTQWGAASDEDFLADSYWQPRIIVQTMADGNAVVVAMLATYVLCIDIDSDNLPDVLSVWSLNFE